MDFYTPEQRRAYMGLYRSERLAWAFDYLGKKCVKCGLTSGLEFDHIDPATKVKAVTKMLHASSESFRAEVRKCQLLCTECHKERHPASHGKRTMWRRGCRCSECWEWRRRENEAIRNYKRKVGL